MTLNPLSFSLCSLFQESERKPTFALRVGWMFVFEGSLSSFYQNLVDGTASHLEHKHIALVGGKREDPARVHSTNITRAWKSLMNADFLGLS